MTASNEKQHYLIKILSTFFPLLGASNGERNETQQERKQGKVAHNG